MKKISLVWFDRVIAKTKTNAIILPLSVVYIPTLWRYGQCKMFICATNNIPIT